jgi:hypothetical protein
MAQARSIAESSPPHAQLPRFSRHQAGKTPFRAAQALGNDHGDIIGGLGDQGQNSGFNVDFLPGFQAQFRRLLPGCVPGDCPFCIKFYFALFQRLENHIEGHDFG